MSKQTKYEWRNVDDLIPYARNARTHSPEQVAKLASSIKEFGFINPVIISEDGGVLAGHGRIMAANKLGIKEVPCVVESHLTEAQKRAYILADNRLALDAGWDEEMLKIELSDLKEMDFDMDLLGFNEEELSAYLDAMEDESNGVEDSEDDEVEVDEESEPITKPGYLWRLGEHRLICGDSTDTEIVKRLFGDRKPILMVTDPPYGVNYDPETSQAYRCHSKEAKGAVLNDDRADWKDAYKLFPGHVAYVWHSALSADVVMNNLRDCGFNLTAHIVWNKNLFAISYGDYKWKHEVCLYATKGNHNWKGSNNETTVWDIPCTRFLKDEEGAWGHGTQKPIECMLRPILNNTDEGDWVYDPFCGSGTTLIAAEKSKRKCLCVELSPQYCDAIIRRWQSETGEDAALEGKGVTFNDLLEQRES